MAAAVVLVAVILVVVWLVVRDRNATRAFLQAAAPAQAEITDIRWKTVGPLPDRDRLAYPLLRFSLPDGSVIEARSEAPAAEPHEVGERVAVLYLPGDPSRVRLESHQSPSTGSTSGA